MNWEKVFDKDQDGCSLITFFKSCKGNSTSILIIEDLDGYKFGAFCLEAWQNKPGFYGTAEQLLFTFKDTLEEPKVFDWQVSGDQH